MDIYNGDVVFVYEYKNRKNKNVFESLIEIEVENVVDNLGNKIASGYILSNGNYKLDANGNMEKANGIVVYKREKHILINGSEKLYISYEIKNNKPTRVLKKYNKTELFRLYACFKFDEHVKVKLPVTDVLFSSVEDAQTFINTLNVKYPRLYSDLFTLEINKQQIETKNYDVFVNGEKILINPKERLFRYVCKYKNPINNVPYDFQKIFSARFESYELFEADI